MRRKEKGMEEIVVSDACGDLKKEVQVLRMLLASLTAERDDLRYHVCPELEARYASEIGGLENRANYLNIKIAEMKRRIEIARAALNREKTVSREDMDRQVHREYMKAGAGSGSGSTRRNGRESMAPAAVRASKTAPRGRAPRTHIRARKGQTTLGVAWIRTARMIRKCRTQRPYFAKS